MTVTRMSATKGRLCVFVSNQYKTHTLSQPITIHFFSKPRITFAILENYWLFHRVSRNKILYFTNLKFFIKLVITKDTIFASVLSVCMVQYLPVILSSSCLARKADVHSKEPFDFPCFGYVVSVDRNCTL